MEEQGCKSGQSSGGGNGGSWVLVMLGRVSSCSDPVNLNWKGTIAQRILKYTETQAIPPESSTIGAAVFGTLRTAPGLKRESSMIAI